MTEKTNRFLGYGPFWLLDLIITFLLAVCLGGIAALAVAGIRATGVVQ